MHWRNSAVASSKKLQFLHRSHCFRWLLALCCVLIVCMCIFSKKAYTRKKWKCPKILIFHLWRSEFFPYIGFRVRETRIWNQIWKIPFPSKSWFCDFSDGRRRRHRALIHVRGTCTSKTNFLMATKFFKSDSIFEFLVPENLCTEKTLISRSEK